MKKIEDIIISSLIHKKDYFRRVLPYIKLPYFQEKSYQVIFEEITTYYDKFNKVITPDELEVQVVNKTNLFESDYKKALEIVEVVKEQPDVQDDWLMSTTEAFCKSRDIYLTTSKALEIMHGEDKTYTIDAIPDMLRASIGISFDPNVGHDYFEDWETRYAKYHETLERLPFKLKSLNKITHGGITKKTLNMLAAGTGAFKSGTMCDFAAHYLNIGKNVLYISMEMADVRIAERIEANLMKLTIQDVHKLSKNVFYDKLQKIHDGTKGKLIIKEYPTATVHVGHFRALLNELDMKKGFKPDVIFIDYLNLCIPMRFKGSDNLYTNNKAVAEELRGLAMEYDLPIWSATQLVRGANGSSDVGLKDISESHGIAATADLMLALITTDELEEKSQILVKQLKNRYNDKAVDKSFMLSVDKARMTIKDFDDGQQLKRPPQNEKIKDIIDDLDQTFELKPSNKFAKFK